MDTENLSGFSTTEPPPRADTPPTHRSPSEPVQDIVCRAHLLIIGGISEVSLSNKPCLGKHVKVLPILNEDKFFQNGPRVTDGDTAIVVHLCRPHRQEYQLRSVERKCLRAECSHLGILMELQTGKISECAKHISGRLANVTPKAAGPLTIRKAKITAKQTARHQRACELSDVPSENCPDTSSSSESQTMPTLELSQDDVTAPRKDSNEYLLPNGSTLDDVQPGSATHMEQTVHDLMARLGMRRSSTGYMPSVPDERGNPPNYFRITRRLWMWIMSLCPSRV